MTTRTTKRTRRFSLPLLLSILLYAGSASAQTETGIQSKTGRKPEPYAIVTGTVFRDPGFAQPGASVILSLKSAPKKKLQEQISSPRGEFSFHVPAHPNTYLLTASLKGFQTVQKEVEIQGEEQINATLLLIPESKEKRR